MQQRQLQDKNPYYKENEVLKRYVEDGKQRFEVVVLPQVLSSAALQLAPAPSASGGSSPPRRSTPGSSAMPSARPKAGYGLRLNGKERYISDQVTATTQATSMVTAEIVTKSIKLKQD